MKVEEWMGKYPRAGMGWGQREIDRLALAWRSGDSTFEIARRHGRRIVEVVTKLCAIFGPKMLDFRGIDDSLRRAAQLRREDEENVRCRRILDSMPAATVVKYEVLETDAARDLREGVIRHRIIAHQAYFVVPFTGGQVLVRIDGEEADDLPAEIAQALRFPEEE